MVEARTTDAGVVEESKEPVAALNYEVEPVETPMSKNQLKKLKRKQEWKRIKAEKIAAGTYKRNQKKKNKETFAHLTRFNQLSEVDAEGNERRLSKKEKQQLYKDLCLKGPRIVIDCDFESLMMDKEVKSLASQLSYCVNANKQFDMPMNLIMTGLGDKTHAALTKSKYENWGIQTYRKTSYIDASPVKSVYNEVEASEQIEKSRLIYLTADSDVTLNELNPQDVYIIGGIVDRNRYPNLTLKRA